MSHPPEEVGPGIIELVVTLRVRVRGRSLSLWTTASREVAEQAGELILSIARRGGGP